MNELEWSYLAGYIDADGCISLTKSKDGHHNISLGVSSINKGILDWILECTGYGKITEVKFNGNIFHKTRKKKQWLWRTHHNGMRYVLPKILPHLKNKKRQAELTMEFLEICNKTSGRWTSEIDKKRKQEIEREMKILNHRGVDYVSL